MENTIIAQAWQRLLFQCFLISAQKVVKYDVISKCQQEIVHEKSKKRQWNAISVKRVTFSDKFNFIKLWNTVASWQDRCNLQSAIINRTKKTNHMSGTDCLQWIKYKLTMNKVQKRYLQWMNHILQKNLSYSS